MKLPPSLRALHYYNFRLYFFGQAISLIGTWMQRIALNWLVPSLRRVRKKEDREREERQQPAG